MRKRYGTIALTALLLIVGANHSVAQSAQQREQESEALAAKQKEAVDEARRQVEQRLAVEQVIRQEEAKANTLVPIDVEVVITRFQGDKKVSSLPYSLTVNAKDVGENQRPLTQLRMGGQVPLPTMAPAVGPDGKSATGFVGGGPVQYKEVGTDIDARARPMGDGRFEVWISVSDSGVAMPQGSTPGGNALPVIRTFRSSNNLVLRDGQTRQFTAASDRITGEVVRVDVTLKVVK